MAQSMNGPSPMVAQQGQIIYVGVAPPASNVREKYPSKPSIILGITQVVIGLVCIILQSAVMGLGSGSGMHYIATGIWCGIFFIINGAFGIVAGKQRTTCPIVTHLVLSVLSAAIFATTLLGISIHAAIVEALPYSFLQYDHYDYNGQYSNARFDYLSMYKEMNAIVGMNATLAVVAVIEGIVAIVASAFCCQAVCCGKTRTHGQVLHLQPHAQQMVVIGPNDQVTGNYPLAANYGMGGGADGYQYVAVPQKQDGLAAGYTGPPPYDQVYAMEKDDSKEGYIYKYCATSDQVI